MRERESCASPRVVGQPGKLGNLDVPEYLHLDFGAKNYFDPPVVDIVTVNTRRTTLTDDIVRAGLNYRFGWGGPVVAKY